VAKKIRKWKCGIVGAAWKRAILFSALSACYRATPEGGFRVGWPIKPLSSSMDVVISFRLALLFVRTQC
jgi:hypothetical protein